MISKKNLLFIHNSSIALQMVSFLKKSKLDKKKSEIFIFIEKNFHNLQLIREINYIFKDYKIKLLVLKKLRFNLFTVKNFLEWKEIFLINNSNHRYIKYFLRKNKINLEDFDEIFYSNERNSNYINYIFKKKKIFFFHGIGDIKIFINQNIIKNIKNRLFHYINFVFNKIELPTKKSLSASILKEFIKPKYNNKNILKIHKKTYRKNFKNFSLKELSDINFKPKANFILYILKFPRFKMNDKDNERTKYLINYLNFQFLEINNYINKNNTIKNYDIILKTKNNITSKESKIINQIAKKYFRKRIQLFTNKKNSYVNAEILGAENKCKVIISNISTADFLIKIINNKVKIVQYNKLVYEFNIKDKFINKNNVDMKISKLKNYYKMDKYIII